MGCGSSVPTSKPTALEPRSRPDSKSNQRPSSAERIKQEAELAAKAKALRELEATNQRLQDENASLANRVSGLQEKIKQQEKSVQESQASLQEQDQKLKTIQEQQQKQTLLKIIPATVEEESQTEPQSPSLTALKETLESLKKENNEMESRILDLKLDSETKQGMQDAEKEKLLLECTETKKKLEEKIAALKLEEQKAKEIKKAELAQMEQELLDARKIEAEKTEMFREQQKIKEEQEKEVERLRLEEERKILEAIAAEKKARFQKHCVSQNLPSRVVDEGIVRVFMSSTFLDMQKERDHFFFHGATILKEFAKGYGVEIVFIDLRWGLTQEDSQHGKVVIRCCESIEKCPYFVCFLGARYGWIPNREHANEWDPETSLRYPQIASFLNKSVTEYEILYAAMCEKPASNRALFYFRDQEYSVQNLQPGEAPTLYLPISDELRVRQDELKKIITERFPVKTYQGKVEFVDFLVEDLKFLIEMDFKTPEETNKEDIAHSQFMRHRLAGFEGRQLTISDITQHIETQLQGDDARILALAAESGIGKSSLMAAMVREMKQKHTEDMQIIYHFVGCTNASTFVSSILQRLWAQVNQGCKLGLDLEDKKDKDVWKTGISRLFDKVKEAKAARPNYKLVIFIDAVNQLVPSQDYPKPFILSWLPFTAPQNVAVVVSTIHTHCTNEVLQDKTDIIPVKRLTIEETIQAATSYLSRYDKKLTEQQIHYVANDSEDTGHPLYLRIFLDELRVFGIYEKLDSEIMALLSTNGVVELYHLVTSRWESKYGAQVVTKALSVLYVSRLGLNEDELDNYVAFQLKSEFVLSDWKSFLYTLVDSLFVRNGRYAFFHQLLMEAVQTKYLGTDALMEETYFNYGSWLRSNNEITSGTDDAIVSEIIFSLLRSKRYQVLVDFLCLEQVVVIMMNKRKFEFLETWVALKKLNYDDCALYADKAKTLNECGKWLIDYFRETQQHSFLVPVIEERLSKFENQSDKDFDFFTLGWVNYDIRRFDKAISYHEEALKIRIEKLGEDNSLVADSYNHIGLCNWAKKKLQDALRAYEKSIAIRRRLYGEDHVDVAQSLNNFGAVYHTAGNFDKALEYYILSNETYKRVCGEDHPDVGTSYNNIAVVHDYNGNHEDSLLSYQKSLNVLLRFYGEDNINVSQLYANIAVLHQNHQRYKEALDSYSKAYSIRVKMLGENHQLTTSAKEQLRYIQKRIDYEEREKERTRKWEEERQKQKEERQRKKDLENQNKPKIEGEGEIEGGGDKTADANVKELEKVQDEGEDEDEEELGEVEDEGEDEGAYDDEDEELGEVEDEGEELE